MVFSISQYWLDYTNKSDNCQILTVNLSTQGAIIENYCSQTRCNYKYLSSFKVITFFLFSIFFFKKVFHWISYHVRPSAVFHICMMLKIKLKKCFSQCVKFFRWSKQNISSFQKCNSNPYHKRFTLKFSKQQERQKNSVLVFTY